MTVQILDDTPAVLTLGKLCEEHGYAHEWASGQKPRLTKQGKNILCKTENIVPLVVPGLSSSFGTSSSSTSPPQNSSTSSRPATERSDETAPGNWHDSKKKKKLTKMKRGMAVEMRTTVCEIFLNGWRSSPIIWSPQKCLHLYTFLMTQIRNVLHKWHTGSTVFILASQKIEIAKYACEPR